jgi:hypothetical protein
MKMTPLLNPGASCRLQQYSKNTTKVYHGYSYATVSGTVSPEGVLSVLVDYAMSDYNISNIHDDTLLKFNASACRLITMDPQIWIIRSALFDFRLHFFIFRG